MKDPEGKASAPDAKVDRIRKEFDRYMARWEKSRAQSQDDMKCLSMDGPWPDAERRARNEEGAKRPCLHEDIVSQYINQVVNQMEMNPMGIDVQPDPGPDLEVDQPDEESAEFVENRIRQIDYEQNGPHAYLNAGKCAVESSMGYWEIETDWVAPFSWEKRIRICPVMNPATILPDPDAKEPDWCDMQGYFKTSRMSHEEFKRKYPSKNADFKGFEDINTDSVKWFDDHSVQVVAFTYVEKKRRNLLMIDDGTPEGWSIFEDELPAYLKKKGKSVVIAQGMPELAEFGYQTGDKFPVLRESKRDWPEVFKCVTNGIEILDETQWEDTEVPLLVVTGRVKYENNERVIESLTRKSRIGQLLYDHCISAIQEVVGSTPKFKIFGYEGQFDTSTDWKNLFRSNTAYAEALPRTESGGSEESPLPLPQLVQVEPPIQALMIWKDAILLSVQNAIGMTSTERKDRAAKSGKALEQLDETMNVATYHYHKSLRMAQLRNYRIMNRLLEKVENTEREVGLRDVKGNYSTQRIERGHYAGKRHQVVIGSDKYYQTLQQEQSDFAEALMASVKDPMIMLAVLPGIIKMRGLGPYGDELAKMVEAMQPPQMQQARMGEGQGLPPEAMQAIQSMKQQAEQQIQSLNAHAQELEQKVIELEDEKQAKVLDLASKERIASEDNNTKIEIATINASVKSDIVQLQEQIAVVKHISDVLTDRFKIGADAEQQNADRQQTRELTERQASLSAEEQERQRQHEAEMATEAQPTP